MGPRLRKGFRPNPWRVSTRVDKCDGVAIHESSAFSPQRIAARLAPTVAPPSSRPIPGRWPSPSADRPTSRSAPLPPDHEAAPLLAAELVTPCDGCGFARHMQSGAFLPPDNPISRCCNCRETRRSCSRCRPGKPDEGLVTYQGKDYEKTWEDRMPPCKKDAGWTGESRRSLYSARVWSRS